MSKRAEQKTAARVVRDQIARERRQRRIMWTTLGVVLAVLIAGAVGYGVWQAQQPTKVNIPATATAQHDGMIVANTSGKTRIDIWLDYQCPACKAFESQIGSTMDQWVQQNKVTLVYHPVAILNAESAPNMYSTRAAAAAGCAADDGKLYDFSKALYSVQPAENTGGLTDDQIIAAGGTVGLVAPSFAQCVRSTKYDSWTTQLTNDFTKNGLSGTPTVFVNNKQLTPQQTNLSTLQQLVGS